MSITSTGLTDLTPTHAQEPELLKSLVRYTRVRCKFSPKGRHSITKQIYLKKKSKRDLE